MTEHTPGPWEASERGDYSDFDGESSVVLGDDRRIAVVHHSGTAEQEANARLIAAAPDLAEAVKEAERMFRWYGDLHAAKSPPDTEKAERNYAIADKMKAALSKARESRND